MVRFALAASLIVLCLASLVRLHLGWDAAAPISMIALAGFYLFGIALFRLRERLLLSIGMGLTVMVVMVKTDGWQIIERGAHQAAFLAAFMILLALLREGAATSNSVLALGSYLTKQPPNRRYIAIHSGSHALGVILNFGCLSLLGPLIQRGIKAQHSDNAAINALRERRQISALMRGFSWIIAWSPTAVSQALVPGIITGVHAGKLALMGATIAFFITFIGWAEDLIFGQRARRQLSKTGQLPPSGAAPPLPWNALFRFGLVCLSLTLFAVSVIAINGARTVPALMLAAPIITAVWLWFQCRRDSAALTKWRQRIAAIITRSIPQSSPEALTLSIAGYCGILAAGLIDTEWLGTELGLAELSPLTIYLAVAFIIPVCSNLAMPPIFLVTFLAAVLTSITNTNLDPTLLGLACICGWALNLTASPFGATTLVLARVTGLDGQRITWRWNGVFSIMAFFLVAAALIIFNAVSS